MPKKDPITGCQVMTLPEFLNKEAEIEGQSRCGMDILDDVFQELDKESNRVANEWKDPKVAWEIIAKAAYWEWESWISECRWIKRHEKESFSERPIIPIKLIGILGTGFHQNFNSCNGQIKAVVLCDDCVVRNVVYKTYDTVGSFYDPPDNEEFLEWEEEIFKVKGFHKIGIFFLRLVNQIRFNYKLIKEDIKKYRWRVLSEKLKWWKANREFQKRINLI